MTAPDRIWANVAMWVDYKPVCGEWNHCDVGSASDAQYIRADLHEAIQAENERLRKALIRTVIALRKIAHPVGPLHSAWDDIFNAEDALK